MIYTRPQNPQLVRTHPLSSNLRAAYLFGDPGRYVVDYAGFQNLSNASTGVGPVAKVTGRTGIFGNTNLITGSDLFLPGGTSPFSFVYRGMPDQNSVGCIFNYGTSGTTGAYRGLRFTGANFDLLGWGADANMAHGLGAVTLNQRVVLAGKYDGTNVYLYVKIASGVMTKSSAIPLSLNLVKTGTMTINKTTFNSEYHGGWYELIYIWGRCLTDPEVLAVTEDPYQIFNDTSKSYTFGPGVSSVVAADSLAQPWTDAIVTGVGISRISVADTFTFTDALATSASVTRITFSDSISMSDALIFRSGLLKGDSLNSWADTLTYDYLAPSTPLSVSVVDKFIRGGTVEGNNLSLRDGFAYVRGPSGPVYVSISDLGSFLNDDLRLGLTLSLGDSLNSWSDATGPSYGLSVSAFDSMFYNLFDSFAFGFDTTPVGGGAGDSFTLTDGISIQLNIALSFGDSLSFADSFGGTFLSVNAFGDTLSMTDLFGLQMNIGLAFTDFFTLLDAVDYGEALLLGTSVSDDLNNWQDGFASQSSTGETTYLRQYLNDVIN